MSRTAKIAGVAALAGLMMTVAIVAAVQPDEPAPAPPLVLPADEGQARLARELDRCASLTMPDILVKPTRPDLSTNLVINTDRRTYHLELDGIE